MRSTSCQGHPTESSIVSILESRHLCEMEIDEIKRRLRETGKSQAGLAKALGTDPSIITRILKGQRELKAKELPIIRAYLAVPADGDDNAPTPNVSKPVELPLKDIATWPKDVPVLGTALGSKEDEFLVIDEIIEHRHRMPGAMGKNKVYGLYVQGDSMSPWAESGSLIFVDPDVPPAIGDYIVIQMKLRPDGERQAFVKRLVARTPTKLKVLQHNPHKEFDFPLEKVDRVHRVMTNKDLS